MKHARRSSAVYSGLETDQVSYIVASIPNAMAGAPALALIDVATSEVRALRVPGWRPEFGGITGLAVSDRYLYAVTQWCTPPGGASGEGLGPSCLLIFDRDGLALRAAYTCSSVFRAHSILPANGGLYVVSTGTDELVKIELEGAVVTGERVIWRPDPTGPREDNHHLNAICRWRGDLVVAGMGRRISPQWRSATDGFIVNVRTGERLASGLRQPHSLLEVDGDLALSESSARTVRILGSARSRRLVGYPRGLCQVGGAIFVGVSRGRQISKSTGALVPRMDLRSLDHGEDPDAVVGRCSVVRLSPSSLEIEGVVDVDDYGWEIYDLLPVEDASGWPVASEVGWRGEAIRSLRERLDERDVTIARLRMQHPMDVTALQCAVAKRDRILAPLGVLALARLLRRLRAAVGGLRRDAKARSERRQPPSGGYRRVGAPRTGARR